MRYDNFTYNKSNEYITPDYIVDYCENIFGHKFDLDVAATKENTKCKNFYTFEDDGLRNNWYGHVWCNPPYTGDRNPTTISRWVHTGIHEIVRELGRTSYCKSVTYLLKANVDQKWFSVCLNCAKEIMFLQGRVQFVGEKSGATFPCVIIHIDKESMYSNKQPEISSISLKSLKRSYNETISKKT